jgi:hypothetical protein
MIVRKRPPGVLRLIRNQPAKNTQTTRLLVRQKACDVRQQKHESSRILQQVAKESPLTSVGDAPTEKLAGGIQPVVGASPTTGIGLAALLPAASDALSRY